jgi:hypothetical protein
MLDKTPAVIKIELVGGEDRALLRSNPSARADAGKGALAGFRSRPASRPKRTNHPGRKALNRRAWGSAPASDPASAVPFGNI